MSTKIIKGSLKYWSLVALLLEKEIKMNILEKLHEIEEKKCIYNIHYCKAGIGFCFYDENKDTGTWREALTTNQYYGTFEEAVEAEYKKL